jgi:thymidylate synthase (FAD)
MNTVLSDPYFRVENLRSTLNPQQLVWLAAHQDVTEEYIIDTISNTPSESMCGKHIIKHLISRSHWGPFEHPHITFAIGNYPHSTMQQFSRHRLTSIDCQSFRYTGNRIEKVASGELDIEEVVYLRPAGVYTSRTGVYTYTEEQRTEDLLHTISLCKLYASKVAKGIVYEHARSLLPFDVRQSWVATLNCRSLLHVLDERSKKDAQLEIQALCSSLLDVFSVWMPAVADWYYESRYTKARTAP